MRKDVGRYAAFRNFIYYLLLCAVLATGVYEKTVCTAFYDVKNHLSFAERFDSVPSQSLLSLIPASQTNGWTTPRASSLGAPSLHSPVDFWVSQIAPRRGASSIATGARSQRVCSVWNLLEIFLFHILTLMSVFSRCNERIVASRDSRYVVLESFTIFFMRRADGRKRGSYLPA